MSLFTILRPIIHALPPEVAHNLGLYALRGGLLPARDTANSEALHTNAFGLTFKNPIGLAAGFDKNACAINALLKQGFGFVEAGTVTPKPQAGNPAPRVFRLARDAAIINRLGFNNRGLAEYARNFSCHQKTLGIAGANIGKNKDSSDAAADYVTCIKAVSATADYITINISSPNTQGLRELQKKDALGELLATLVETRNQSAKRVPLILKVAPDLTMQEKEDIAAQVLAHCIDGMIISNTTLSRPDSLRSDKKREQGGLSGRPLFALSTSALADFYKLTGGKIPLIGVGGVGSAEDAYRKIKAGATLVQLYSALVYQGFGLVSDIKTGLSALLARDGYSHVSQAIGKDT